ncbi:S8 family serine peptidase, partial [Candidatus Woesearchaeota archaeon]|nr:S8 family serine peptidase [Candidatus Woesearchaeota archaeon]
MIILFICILLEIPTVKGNLFTDFFRGEISAEYDSESINAFNNLTFAEENMLHNATNYQTLDIIDNKVWLRVMIRLKDNSQKIISGTKEEKIELIKQKEEWFEPVIEDVLKTLSEEDMKIAGKSSNGFDGLISKQGFEKLIRNEKVKEINWPKRGAVGLLDESAPLINADDIWGSYSGDGVDICIIDSGVDTDHSDLSGIIINEQCYCCDNFPNCGDNDNGCCPDGTAQDTSAEDDNGHGTHVTGIIASQDSIYKGIAYDGDIYAVKILDDDGDLYRWQDLSDAIDWCRNQGVDVISISIGDHENYPGANPCPNDVDNEINAAFNVDIPVIIASGNDGYTNGINYPACSANAISVGSVYDDDVGWQVWATADFPWICSDWADTDQIVCSSNRGANLDLLAPGCEITSTWNDGGFEDHCGTSMAAPHVAGAAALLLEKDSDLDPGDILATLQNTGVNIAGTGANRIDVEAAINNICVCSDWVSGSCGGGTCNADDREETRTCTDNCDDESRCVDDPVCEGGTPSGVSACTPPSCDGGYDDQGIGNGYLVDNKYWTWKRTCWKEELSDWQFHDGDNEQGAGWKSDGRVDCDDMYVDIPDDYEDLKVETYVGYDSSSGEQNKVKWYVDAEDTGGVMSSCSSHTSSYSLDRWPSDCGANCLVETYVDLFKGTSNCDTICDNNWLTGCDDINYWIDCSADLYYKEYEDIYDYKYCDVPYTKTITIDSTIYGDSDADCYVDVEGSYSDPDEIRVKWYVEGDYKDGEDKSCNEGADCDKTFTLSNSYFSKNDGVYCRARGYGEDEGHGAYVSSSTTTVSNRVSTISSISLDKSYAKQGDIIQVTASGETDLDSDILAMYCCEGSSCTPTVSSHDFCYVTGDSSPYDLQCNGQGASGNETKTVRCRIYDGDDHSTIQSDTYIADNIAPNITNTETNITIANLNEYARVNCTATDSGGISAVLIEAEKPISNNSNYSTSLLSGDTYYADIQLTEAGVWNFNCWVNDTVNNIANKTNGNITVIPDDAHKFTLKNTNGEIVAWFGNEGNIVLNGTCISGGTCTAPANSFIISNSTDNTTAY